jgi:hypothetical protein
MRKIAANSVTDDSHLLLFAWAWLGVGVLAMLVFPALRHTHPTFGWLPFWCVIAPAVDLAVLERRRWFEFSRAWLRRAAHRRRPTTRQARRHAQRRRQRQRLAPLVAALLSR